MEWADWVDYEQREQLEPVLAMTVVSAVDVTGTLEQRRQCTWKSVSDLLGQAGRRVEKMHWMDWHHFHAQTGLVCPADLLSSAKHDKIR